MRQRQLVKCHTTRSTAATTPITSTSGTSASASPTAVVLRLTAQDSTAAACLAGLGFVALLVSTVLGVGWGLAQRSRPDGSSP